MEYYRTKTTGERVYIAESKQFPSQPGKEKDQMVYRVRDGHALWGYSIDNVIPESEWLKEKRKKQRK